MQRPILRSIHRLLGWCMSCHQKQFYPTSYHSHTSSSQSVHFWNMSVFSEIGFCHYTTATRINYPISSSCSDRNMKADDKSNPAREAKLEEERRATEILGNLSPDEEKKLKVLKLEYDIMLSSGSRVPENMTNFMWLKLLECKSVAARTKMYKYWRIRESSRIKNEHKKLLKREKHLARLQERAEKDDGTYPNRILKKIKDDDYHKHNLAFSMIHGPHLVIDMSYDDMREQDAKNLVSQFLKCHGYNKVQTEPFHFHFCNVKEGSLVDKALRRYFINLDHILYTVSEESYLEHYPQQNLVYLSPYAKQSLTDFSYNDVYILGGIVDKVSELPLSIAKAKRDRLRCVKLPLDQYLQWTKGSKALTLDQMVMILHTLKQTNDWNKAFEHVPKRKFLWLHEQSKNDKD